MLDGRVKTLHPLVHGGLLYIRGNAEHEAAVAAHGIQPIDMVVVNLYAFEKTAAQPGVAFGHLIENIDIGGPSMVRSAAKNFEDVAIVTRVADYPALARGAASRTGGALSRETRWRLAKQAFALTAAYDSAIATTLETHRRCPRTGRTGRARHNIPARNAPHQPAARRNPCATAKTPTSARRSTRTAPASASQARNNCRARNSASTISSTSMPAGSLTREFDEPMVAIIKHTNPCGAATGPTVLEAYQKALACDPVSAFGGVIGINRESRRRGSRRNRQALR